MRMLLSNMRPRRVRRAGLVQMLVRRYESATSIGTCSSSNNLKRKLALGQPALGALSYMHRETTHVEMLGIIGYDYLWLDTEHGTASPASAEHIFVAAERRGLPVITRVAGHNDPDIMKYLWAGSTGILIPQCNTALEASDVVQAVKFPPHGRRGLAGDRWNNWNMANDLADAVPRANAQTIVGIQIESAEGLANIDEILTVEHVDFVFLGPTDLSAVLGIPGQIRHPDLLALMEQLGQKIIASGKAAGTLILTSDDYKYWRSRGFTVNVAVVQKMLLDGATRCLEECKVVDAGIVDQRANVSNGNLTDGCAPWDTAAADAILDKPRAWETYSQRKLRMLRESKKRM